MQDASFDKPLEVLQKSLEAEARSVIKRILTDMEEMGMEAPDKAVEPLAYNERRKRVMRSIWNLVKLAIAAGGRLETEYETDPDSGRDSGRDSGCSSCGCRGKKREVVTLENAHTFRFVSRETLE